MKKGVFSSKKGFTIIEVALVLAIGGLIFMMVFIALPALQRTQRDTRRRDDVMTLLETVKKYQTNNRGALPTGGGVVSYNPSAGINGTTWQHFYNGYLKETFVDPDGENYVLDVVECGAGADADCTNTVATNVSSSSFPYTVSGKKYVMVIVKQATCYGDKAIGASNPRKIAVLYKLEGAGVYCNNT